MDWNLDIYADGRDEYTSDDVKSAIQDGTMMPGFPVRYQSLDLVAYITKHGGKSTTTDHGKRADIARAELIFRAQIQSMRQSEEATKTSQSLVKSSQNIAKAAVVLSLISVVLLAIKLFPCH